MKLLLDENLPNRLKRDFEQHEVSTVRENGWSGVSNGELLRLMLDAGFSALLTFDKNLQHQQNFSKYPIAVLVISAKSNQYKDLTHLSQKINDALSKLAPGVTLITE